MKKVFMFLFLFSFLIGFSNNAKAAPTEVNTVAELKDLVENATSEIEIKLGDSFPKDEDVVLDINHLNEVKIIGNKEHLVLSSEFTINIRKHHDDYLQHTRFDFQNFHFDGKGEKNVGFTFGRFDNNNKIYFINDIHINGSTFENSVDSVINVESPVTRPEGTTQIIGDNLVIKNNKSENSGAIVVNDWVHLSINHSNLFNNENSSNEVGGGAITALGENVYALTQSSRFENNRITGTAQTGKELGGGAIFSNGYNGANTSSYRNHFEGNETNMNDSQNGGAIFVSKRQENTVNIDYLIIGLTTFSKNKSSGEGGAVAVNSSKESQGYFHFDDSLFYENSSKKKGGALSIYSEKKIPSYKDFQMRNITYYKNSSGQSKGGALSLSKLEYDIPIKSSIFIDNTGEKNYENVVSTEGKIYSTLNLGIDNGTASEVKSEDVFGKYPVPLTDNRGTENVGAEGDSISLRTISVIPRFTNDENEVTKGLADLYEHPFNGKYPWDHRDMESDFLTLGSVNNASILYDGNGGNFNLPQLKEFTGEEYYEGAKPKQYASLELPGIYATVKDGNRDLSISREGYIFAGWSTEKNGELTELRQPGNRYIIQGQTKLFAVWKAIKYQSKYFGNGHTAGVAPKMTAATYEATEKVKDENTLKRTGYTFLGWSEKATASKADPTLKPGMDYKVGLKNNFYAIWQRDSNEVKFAANKATSGTAPKSAKVLYGNSVKLKNAGNLKRKGYTFTGWSTNKKATKAQYKVGKSVEITKPTTLYAVWKKAK